MTQTKFRNRHRLSRKEIKALEEEMTASMGFAPFGQESPIDVAEWEKYTVILDGTEVVGIFINDRPYPTIRGLLKSPPRIKFVTVDMGAIKYVANGADVMAPGIVEADPGINEGDVVWVRDMKNFKPLAIGFALRSGAEMIADKKGKAVKSLHYVGDEIWGIGQEPQ